MPKGVYIKTESHKKNISKAQKGNKYALGKHWKVSEKGRENMSKSKRDENNPMFSRKHSEKTKRKISKAMKGKEISEEHKRKIGIANKGKKVEHHIYLKENGGETIKLSRSKHRQLHERAYDYLVKINEISNYLKWFDKKFGLS